MITSKTDTGIIVDFRHEYCFNCNKERWHEMFMGLQKCVFCDYTKENIKELIEEPRIYVD